MIFQGPTCIYQGTLPRGIGKVPIPEKCAKKSLRTFSVNKRKNFPSYIKVSRKIDRKKRKDDNSAGSPTNSIKISWENID